MREAVIVDCLRTAGGQGSARGAAEYAAGRSGGDRDPRAAGTVSGGEGRSGGCDPGVRDAGGRGGQQYGAPIGAAGGAAGLGAGDDDQSLLQFGAAGDRAGGGSDPRGRRRRCVIAGGSGIDEPDSARRAQAGAESLVRGSVAGGLHEHGADGGAVAAEVRRLARGCGRVRAAQPSERGARAAARAVRRTRSCRCEVENADAGEQSKQTCSIATKGRARTPRWKRWRSCKPVFHAQGTVTAGNSSQTSDGAAAALVMSEREGARAGAEAEGAIRQLRDGGRAAGDHGDRPGGGDSEGAGEGGAEAGRDRRDRVERGLRGAGAGGDAQGGARSRSA